MPENVSTGIDNQIHSLQWRYHYVATRSLYKQNRGMSIIPCPTPTMWLAPFSAESASDSKQWHGDMALPYRPSLANLQGPCFRLSCKAVQNHFGCQMFTCTNGCQNHVNLFVSKQTNGLRCFRKCWSFCVQPIAGERKQLDASVKQLWCHLSCHLQSLEHQFFICVGMKWWDLTVGHDRSCGSSKM